MTTVLTMERVSKSYRRGPTLVEALHEAELSVRPGELVAIMGPSGSGKSTLLTIAGTLENATSGRVLIGGRDVATLPRNERARLRRRAIGYVFQDFNRQVPHGQRRLLEIGVALVARPRLLVLDEPAAGLAETDLPALMRCLTQLPREVTVLLAEHHMDLVTAIADVVTVLHQGSVLAHGTPAEIGTHPQVVDVYLGTTLARPAVT